MVIMVDLGFFHRCCCCWLISQCRLQFHYCGIQKALNCKWIEVLKIATQNSFDLWVQKKKYKTYCPALRSRILHHFSKVLTLYMVCCVLQTATAAAAGRTWSSPKRWTDSLWSFPGNPGEPLLFLETGLEVAPRALIWRISLWDVSSRFQGGPKYKQTEVQSQYKKLMQAYTKALRECLKDALQRWKELIDLFRI